MIRRAARTFFQAALGYVAAHVAVTLTGFAEGRETLRGAVITLAASAVACGIAAVMNLPQKCCPCEQENDEEEDDPYGGR